MALTKFGWLNSVFYMTHAEALRALSSGFVMGHMAFAARATRLEHEV